MIAVEKGAVPPSRSTTSRSVPHWWNVPSNALSFVGDIDVWLDPVSLLAQPVGMALQVDESFGGAIAVVTWNGGHSQLIQLPGPAFLEVPLDDILRSNLLQAGAVGMHAMDATGRLYSLSLESVGSLWKVTQRID